MVKPKVGAGAVKSGSRQGAASSLVVVLALLATGSFGLTQYLAHDFGYWRELGHPMFGAVYAPWKWIEWTITYYHGYKPIFDKAYEVAGFTTAAAFALFALFSGGLRGVKPSGMQDMYGTAHWAGRDEIVQAGLLPTCKNNAGVYVGGWAGKRGRVHYLRHNGPEHVLAFAPTRSGKGVGLVIPTLLSWPESVVVLDIKGENYALTSGWRKKHANNVVLKFDPAAPEGQSARFNPLDAIRMNTEYQTADVQNLVTMIVDPDGRGLNDHWAKTGHALLVGAVLHVLYKALNDDNNGEKATLAGVLDLLSDTKTPILDVLKGMQKYNHLKSGPDPVVAASATDMLNKAPNERSGVLSTSISFLTLYRDPTVKYNTAESDFTIKNLMNHDKPVSLYLVVSPADKDRLKPLLRLIVNQIVRILVSSPMQYENGAAKPQYNHRLLLLIDEFPSLGRLEIFQEALAFIAGYGLKAYLIVQDMAQLYSSYGKDESVTSNCHIRVAFAPNKPETAEYLSKLTGIQTIVKDSVSTSGQRMAPVMSQVSHYFVEHQRPLLTPDECMRLPAAIKDEATGKITEPGDMLVFAAGTAPIYGRQILYFQDPIFDARSKLPPGRSDRIMPNGKVIEAEPDQKAAATPKETENVEKKTAATPEAQPVRKKSTRAGGDLGKQIELGVSTNVNQGFESEERERGSQEDQNQADRNRKAEETRETMARRKEQEDHMSKSGQATKKKSRKSCELE